VDFETTVDQFVRRHVLPCAKEGLIVEAVSGDVGVELSEFRALCREFVAREITPYHPLWEDEGIVGREAWRKAGAAGLLGFGLPEQVGGGGINDYRFNAAFVEELFRAGASGPGFILVNDILVPYLAELATEEQLQRWGPGLCSGELIGAIAMTEPGAGSDLQGIRTRAARDGDGWTVNGQKTFITNGINADIVIVVARTDPDAGSRGLSLLVVERGMDGFSRGRNLDKAGLHAADTAELSLEDVYVPRDNLLGEEGKGFAYLMRNLPQERLCIGVQAVASIEACLEMTLEYVQERTAFGSPIGSFQHNKFVLAELATQAKIARVFVDWALEAHVRGQLSAVEAAMVKWWVTETQVEFTGRCLQLHGGYGYMREYPISRHWADARIQTIYGGTTEIMKEIIGRSLGL
jgi:alkylation response protein AidB-like acyl-CoA dehydrogenase